MRKNQVKIVTSDGPERISDVDVVSWREELVVVSNNDGTRTIFDKYIVEKFELGEHVVFEISSG